MERHEIDKFKMIYPHLRNITHLKNLTEQLTHRLLDYSNARSALMSPVGTGITQYQLPSDLQPGD
jgi:hypothetical protein